MTEQNQKPEDKKPEVLSDEAKQDKKDKELKAHYKRLFKDHNGVKSPTIRALTALKYNRSQIAKVMNIRYQHVRNVQLMPLKGQK